MSTKKYPGHLLIANPNNPTDELSNSVILLVTHNDSTGVGLQVNNCYTDLTLNKISSNLGIEISRPEPVYFGGNTNQNKIHVVHSLDWSGSGTVALTKKLGITNDISVLIAISQGCGPSYFKACAGYWIWEQGRLDHQLDPRTCLLQEQHRWTIVPATIENVFTYEPEQQWDRAVAESVRYQVSNWF